MRKPPRKPQVIVRVHVDGEIPKERYEKGLKTIASAILQVMRDDQLAAAERRLDTVKQSSNEKKHRF